jgi:hypothetical protein
MGLVLEGPFLEPRGGNIGDGQGAVEAKVRKRSRRVTTVG